MTARQTFSLLLPFIAGSLHCISIQQNGMRRNEMKSDREFSTFDEVEPHLSLDSSLYDTAQLDFNTTEKSVGQNELE